MERMNALGAGHQSWERVKYFHLSLERERRGRTHSRTGRQIGVVIEEVK